MMNLLFEQKERAQVTLHSIGDAVITTDACATVDYLNPMAEALTGWTTAEVWGRPLSSVFQLVDGQSRQPVSDLVADCLREGKTVCLVSHIVLIGRHGRDYDVHATVAPIRGRDDRVLGAVLAFHNVTENRQLTLQLEYDATHDALTGLINRTEFERRLDRAMTSAHQYGGRHVLCYLDLDQFKVVNDTAGHTAGDELLRQINMILSGMFRERDTLARIGGDEFGLLLENCPLERAQLIAQTVVSAVREYRFCWEGCIYQIGVSIGLASITAETESTAQLLTQADVACYIAKEKGRNRAHLYQREDTETVQRHGEILGAAGLRDALEQGQFRLHYQPIVSLQTPDFRPVRYEVLLRVAYKSHPEENSELVLPAAFIPAAERYGLMGAIDRWVIQAAFREYASGIGQTGARIAINLSGNSLSDETLLDFIEAQFAEHAFPPEMACFEITETAAIQSLRQATELMTALKRHGSQFALDDFGSGLSSFRYLKTLPVDYLKIDGSFVKDMVENANDDALVAAINQMSHTLGLQTIAEYTHSRAIVERLRELGVDYAQGYYFGQPMPWGHQQR
jgi:diguanylate cyclase (GGDEF)-like protein/PAS domain S-box-containing protein